MYCTQTKFDVYLCGIERRTTGPFKHLLVNVAVVSSQNRVQLLVVDIEGVHQRHAVGPQLSQKLFDPKGNLQNLRDAQQPSLKTNDFN